MKRECNTSRALIFAGEPDCLVRSRTILPIILSFSGDLMRLGDRSRTSYLHGENAWCSLLRVEVYGRFLLQSCPTRARVTPMSEQQNTSNYIELAGDIVSAFVSNNSVPVAELPALISTVHDALTKVANGSTQQPIEKP